MTEGQDNPAATPTPVEQEQKPIDMILFCPRCGTQHVDAPESDTSFRHRMEAYSLTAEWQDRVPSRWTNPPHRSHLCHNCCAVWRPADVPTNGVAQIKTRGKEDNTWTNSVAAPATSLAAREAAEKAAREVIDAVWSEVKKLAESFVKANIRNYNDHKGVESLERVYDAKRDTAQQIFNQMHNFNEARWKRPDDIVEIILKHCSPVPAGGDEDQRPSCWHCGVVLAYAPKLRCEDCPDECDKEGCEELGCAGSREYHELRCARWVSVDADRVRYDRTEKCTCAVHINGASSTPRG